jgi:hypothetical protein
MWLGLELAKKGPYQDEVGSTTTELDYCYCAV